MAGLFSWMRRARHAVVGAPSSARATAPGAHAAAARPTTQEVDPRRLGRLALAYAPRRDDVPDAGEIVWTWVPYAERDGRGKDRPVLVIARRDAVSVYAVKLTSKPHDHDHAYVSLGSGAWDLAGRPSWIDLDQVYVVFDAGMRREAAALDRASFQRVATELSTRYGWIPPR
ncbi:MAG: type II toxin-antitoxin system PemK/MazF family toxin [Microbacterium sp.]|uniref:type II toxin-antitoxin system PemK/MazF family toxin n=1 Tax=Microbacterium sp. TaxID=51671 RepID=UPI0039E43189